MPGFCAICGKPLKAGRFPDDTCPCSIGDSGERSLRGAAATLVIPHREIGPVLPKPSTTRRLLGSGIEYAFYASCFWALAVVDVITGALFGFLSLFLLSLVVLRDFNAGAFSIAKRVSQMRVVDWRTGRPASNVQALFRNSYYIGLLLLTLLPFIDCFFAAFFIAFIVLDIAMILANRQGRRLGDFLAGTQVVEARS